MLKSTLPQLLSLLPASSARRLGLGVSTFLTMAAGVTGCSYKRTTQLHKYDLESGYRFSKLDSLDKNSNRLFVMLAFSGGGTRAAALSYGVLEELDRVRLRWDADRNQFCSTNCSDNVAERSLLDEVDVISAVSGGSFTAAYYALRGKEIFEDTSPYKVKFLHHPAQRDLVTDFAFRPWNWKYLWTRVEVAAKQWKALFGDATYADLAKKRTRPYLILNSTDILTRGRFEFTQEQFDLFCGDLSAFPIRRAVAASSAFPGLLTPMTLDSHVNDGCGYDQSWLTNPSHPANRRLNFPEYMRASQLLSYRDSDRNYIHVMDGGVADNLGFRSILSGLSSARLPTHAGTTGGWSVMQMRVNSDSRKSIVASDPADTTLAGVPLLDHIVVIVVDAGTNPRRDWGKKSQPPGVMSVLKASTGIPIERLSWDSMDELRQGSSASQQNTVASSDSTRIHAFEVSFDNIVNDDVRDYFQNLETTFQLPRFAVNCLTNLGGALLRRSSLLGAPDPVTFVDFVSDTLQGTTTNDMSHRKCTEPVAKDSIGSRTHFIDIGGHYAFGLGKGYRRHLRNNFGVSLRVVRPSGWGPLLSVGRRHFNVLEQTGTKEAPLGTFGLLASTLGLGYTYRRDHFDITPGLTAGYGFGNFEFNDGASIRMAPDSKTIDRKLEARGSWIVQAELHSWLNVSDRIALTAFAQYLFARPVLEGHTLREHVTAEGMRLGLGFGYRVY